MPQRRKTNRNKIVLAVTSILMLLVTILIETDVLDFKFYVVVAVCTVVLLVTLLMKETNK